MCVCVCVYQLESLHAPVDDVQIDIETWQVETSMSVAETTRRREGCERTRQGHRLRT